MTTDVGRVPDGTGLSQAEPVSRLGPSGFDPSREDLLNEALNCSLNLEETLQAIYDEEVNVGITTMWDGGYDLFIGGAPGWTDPLLQGCVYGAHNIGPWLRLAYDRAYPASGMSAGTAETPKSGSGQSPPARPEGDAQTGDDA